MATWADTATVLAADLLTGIEDPRRDAPEQLSRALAGLGVERAIELCAGRWTAPGWPRCPRLGRGWIGSKGADRAG
jgi:hypothetical protein